MKRKILSLLMLSSILISIFPIMMIPSVAAAETYFSEDFENWNENSWGNNTNGDGYPQILGAAAHSGSYGCRSLATSGGNNVIYQDENFNYVWSDTIGNHSTWKANIWFRSNGNPGIENPYLDRLIHFESISTIIVSIVVQTNGTGDYLWFSSWLDNVDPYWIALTMIQPDTWMEITIRFHEDLTEGYIYIYIDDVLKYSFEGDTTDHYGYPTYLDLCMLGYTGGGSQTWSFDFDDFTLTEDSPLDISLSADLENIDDDGADWVFTDWKYYNFNLTLAGAYVENASLYFSIPTSFENISCGFFANSTYQAYASNMNYTTREGEPCILSTVSWEYDSGTLTTVAIFPIWFESNVLDFWDPADGVDVYCTYNGSSLELLEEDFFRIYSKGGFTMNYETSNSSWAFLLAGGMPFSFYAADDGGTANQWVYNEIWSRSAQHLKILPEIHFITGADSFTLKYGVDYSLGDGEWLQGWWVNIQPDTVHYNGLFTAAVWINMSCTFNGRTDVALLLDSLYMYPHGSLQNNGDPGSWKCWVDLWFSDKNASSVGSGRVNAYEHPMEDNADLWLRWLANNWAPMDNVEKEQRGDWGLLDADNSTILSSERIKMVRYWGNLTVYSGGGGQIIEIPSYETFDFTHSQQFPLTGISDPIFDETIVPVVGAKGLLGALWTMFAALGQYLSENVIFGGLNLWGTFVNFLDSIAAMFGAPKFFTNLFTWISEMLGYLVDSFGYLADVVAAVFVLFTNLMGTFITTMADLITSLVNTFSMIVDIIGGGIGAGGNIWETLGLSQWLMAAMIFYPLYLVILWDTEGMDAVIRQLTFLFGLLAWIFHFLVSVIQFTIGLITSVIESIPVAE